MKSSALSEAVARLNLAGRDLDVEGGARNGEPAAADVAAVHAADVADVGDEVGAVPVVVKERRGFGRAAD